MRGRETIRAPAVHQGGGMKGKKADFCGKPLYVLKTSWFKGNGHA
jgi:hypothetical protein